MNWLWNVVSVVAVGAWVIVGLVALAVWLFAGANRI